MRSRFRAKDPEEVARMRALVRDQNDLAEIPPLTAWRIEHGKPCMRETALKYHARLQTRVPFENLFELATGEDYYGWGKVEAAAMRVGKNLFGRTFNATAVITYSGPSAIFASLVMAKTLSPGTTLLTTPVYLAMHMARKTFTKIHALEGFTVLEEKGYQDEEHQCVVLLPNVLKMNDPKSRYRIAIIDDVLMTGRPLRLLRDHLLTKWGYKPSQIGVGCCVCHKMTLARRDETTPDTWGFATNVDPESGKVRFPWGNANWF